MPVNNPQELQATYFKPLCQIWEERIGAAHKAKERFTKLGNQCNEFFEAGAGFMWSPTHRQEYFNGRLPVPKFKITIAKMFEFVSIYGPHLFWQNADRKVLHQRTLQLSIDMFGDPNDPQTAEIFQAVKAQDDIEQAMAMFANELMRNYLNWSQREQAHGLAMSGVLATTEALVRGMGTLWPTVYKHPGSDEKFTKNMFRSVNNLFIDPDCKDPLWETAGYIILRHVNPIWQVERLFNLPKGTLHGKGSVPSANLQAKNNLTSSNSDAKTFDLIEWYEIWSKCGVGPRRDTLTHDITDELDDTVGDYAYLCIAKNVDFPLNAPPSRFFGDNPASHEDVKEMFEWRCSGYGEKFPVWMDAGRWPVSPLSFIKLPNSPWPLAPGAPGLGELIALNILTSAYVDQTWADRKRILAYMGSAVNEIKNILDSDDALVPLKLTDGVQNSVNEIIQWLDGPQRTTDLLQAMEVMSQNFDKRVGLTELQYGISSTQVRVASDIRTRSEAANIRPEKMSRDVAAWMSDVSQMEMFLAALYVEGTSLTHLLGGYCASQWDALIRDMPLPQLMREMKATVEASDIRRPNHERDTANIQSLQQYLTPLLQAYAQGSGDNEPLNNFLQKVGEAMEMDMSKLKLTRPWAPEPDPEATQLMQAQAQADVQKTAAEAASAEASAIKSRADAAATIAEIGGGEQGEDGMAAAHSKEIEHRQQLRHREEDHQQKLRSNNELLTQKLLFAETEQQIKESALTKQLEIQRERAKQSNRTAGSNSGAKRPRPA